MDHWIPVLTSEAQSTLTYQNWENTGIKTLAVHVSTLLMKPGLAILQTLPNIRSFYHWPHNIVLNACLPFNKKIGAYRFRDHYDGQEITIGIEELISLTTSLQANKVVLPLEAREKVDKDILLLSPYPLVLKKGVLSFESIIQQLESSKDSFYIMGDISPQQIKMLASYKNCLVESDIPAQNAQAGIVYSAEGEFNVLQPAMREDMRLIDEACLCETCTTKLTRAYLHHLLQHTPLLAGRFLMQHNIWNLQNARLP